MYRTLRFGFVAALLAAGAAWVLTTPKTIAAGALDGLEPDLARGQFVYTAGGCASCHAGETGEGDTLKGGMAFASAFGTFYAPNISSDPDAGIGAWSTEDLANAMRHGTSPEGQHYYPAFPYTSYAKVTLADIVSLRAYLQTLPAASEPSKPHDVGFPFNIRRTLGGWKLLFGQGGDDWVIADTDLTETERHGRYLAEALAHCAECHTPRNALGGLQRSKWLSGAPNPTGKGTIPNITPAALDWTAEDIAYYLESGFTPDFDSAGGHMVHVVENFAKLDTTDRAAVAAYLKRVPPVN